MKLSNGIVECKLINGIKGDPGLYVFFPKTGDAVLFDLGSLDKISNKDLLRVKHAFISHTHIDHFIGFDRLLRVNIPHGRSLELCGPEGFIENVVGKLKSYCWNLLVPNQLQFIVHEVSNKGNIKTIKLTNTNNFIPISFQPSPPSLDSLSRPLPSKPAFYVTTLTDGSRIEGVSLDHGTECLSYVCQSPLRFTVKTEELKKFGLTAGPWIRDLQIALAKGESEKQIICDGKTFNAAEIGSEILIHSAPRSIGYLTDIDFSWENICKIKAFMDDVEIFICESTFMETDKDNAHKKKHLTTKQAALIASYIRAGSLNIFHISNNYHGKEEELLDEAQNYYTTYKNLDIIALENLIKKEL